MYRGPILIAADLETRCLSCGDSSGTALIERIPYREIWDCLRTGGSLYFSVPDRMWSGRALLDPLDCPPRHLTRCSPSSLAAIARRSGLLLPTEVATEPVKFSIPRGRLRERIRDSVRKVLAVGGLLGTWLPRAAWRVVLCPPLLSLHRRYSAIERVGFFGLSVTVRCLETPL